MTLQEKLDKIYPYQEENFITCDTDYGGFGYIINYHFLGLPKDFKIPKEFERYINIVEETEQTTTDEDLIRKELGNYEDDFSKISFDFFAKRLKENNYNGLPSKGSGKFNYIFSTNDYENDVSIDLLLDKTIEFIEFLKANYK